MKKIFLPVFAILFIAFTSSFVAAKWYTYKSKKFRFSIEFPAKPVEQVQDLDSDLGKITLNLQIYEVPENSGDDNYIYLTNATAYPKEMMNLNDADALNNFYSGAIEGAVRNTNGTLLYERTYYYNKLEGREIGMETEEGLIRMKILLDGNVIYMLQTICPVEADNNENMQHFFNSFKLD